jgi:hypothetical protein
MIVRCVQLPGFQLFVESNLESDLVSYGFLNIDLKIKAIFIREPLKYNI